jgi:hypothetical protein
MNSTQLMGLPIPLNPEHYERAAQLAAQQATVDKGKQVYLNALAVSAVGTYLKWLGIQPEVMAGDGWQAGLLSVLDIAHLDLPGIGKLECRPVLPGETTFTIPLEATYDRIGYVAVQFNEQLDSVDLLGFVPPFPDNDALREPPVISVGSLLPLDALLNALHPIHNLRQWLEGIFDREQWHAPEALMGSRFSTLSPVSRSLTEPSGAESEPSFKYSAISQAKVIHLGKSSLQAVVLVIQVMANALAEDALNVRLKLYPTDGATHLPRHLKVTVLSELGDPITDVQTREEDIFVDLELLDCHPSEQFSVSISLEGFSVTEEFVV